MLYYFFGMELKKVYAGAREIAQYIIEGIREIGDLVHLSGYLFI